MAGKRKLWQTLKDSHRCQWQGGGIADSLNTYLLSTYYVSGTTDTNMNETKSPPPRTLAGKTEYKQATRMAKESIRDSDS